MSAELIWGLFVKGSLIVLVATFLALVLRRASGARRHVVWLAALTSLLLLPLAEVRLPNWKVSVDDAPVVRPFVAPRPLRIEAGVAAPANPKPLPAASLPNAPAENAPIDLGRFVVDAWLIGALVFGGWFALGLVRVAALVRSGRRWSPQVFVATPLPRPVRILLCPGLTVPATAGFLRPVLLLPESAPEWSETRLRMVVAHEVAHVVRGDWLWQAVAQLACAVHFFNPLAWIAARNLRAESELACDDIVLSGGVEPTRYAQELLDLAKGARFGSAPLVGMARTPRVESRLRAIVDARRRRNGVSGRTHTGALAVAAVFATLVGVVHAVPSLLAAADGAHRSGVALPHIPWIPSRAVAPNVYLAQNGIAGLPDGVKVRLVGVSVPRNDEFWDMKGATLPDAQEWSIGSRYWQGNVFHRWSVPYSAEFSAFTRRFVVEIESPRDMITATSGAIVRPSPTTKLQRLNSILAGQDGQCDVSLPARDPAYGIIELSIPSRADTADYRFALAGESWTKVSAIDSPLVGGAGEVGQIQNGGGQPIDHCGISLSDEPSIYFTDRSGRYQSRNLLPQGEKLDPGLARRMVLLDHEGNVISQGDNASHDNQGHELFTPDAETFGRIAKVVLFTSPYRYVEFRNVPLRPDYEAETARRLDSGVRGTASGIAPGFSQRLANGVTVSLAAVTKAKLDGDRWNFIGQPSWRGDGRVLAEAPKPPSFTLPIRPWGRLPLYNFDVRYEGARNDATTRVLATGDRDPSFWLYGAAPTTGSVPDSVIATYRPAARTADIRVGVANGPWTTIARVPVDMIRLPATEEGTKAKPTGLAMELDPLPSLTFLNTNRTVALSRRPLDDVARRFVAVTRTGEERPLTAYGAGVKGVEHFGLPARHGEFTERYNDLLASDVKAILLQTRPYDWAEFKGVPLEHR